jgi:hypothetical protein
MSDIESKDLFRDDDLVGDPYRYLAALRGARCSANRITTSSW